VEIVFRSIGLSRDPFLTGGGTAALQVLHSSLVPYGRWCSVVLKLAFN